jgi:alkanesulfonate monooxygenase SsuD/methylene tetrahydromethanopterin reductase-like flavin-dependent oxidoreductase (luciferase family)
MKLSVMTLGDLVADPVTGHRPTPVERHRDIVDTAVLAEQAGFHGINIGEHHGLDYIFSAPPVILSAIGARTEHLNLSTAVTLMANLDAWRAAEDYATVDNLTGGGRVEIVAGRGNFFASTYTLFGQALDESRARFDENIDLLAELWHGEPVTWQGKFRAPIDGQRLQPTPVNTERVPLWIGGGSSPESAELAARLGLGLMLPSAFGNPATFRKVVDVYKERFAEAGHAHEPKVGACWHANIARTSQGAVKGWEPRYRYYFEFMRDLLAKVNPELPNFLKPFDYDWLRTQGPAIVGSPDEFVERLTKVSEMLDCDTNLLYMDMGGLPTGEFREQIELIGEQVIPALP